MSIISLFSRVVMPAPSLLVLSMFLRVGLSPVKPTSQALLLAVIAFSNWSLASAVSRSASVRFNATSPFLDREKSASH